jgi:hypothetical protein
VIFYFDLIWNQGFGTVAVMSDSEVAQPATPMGSPIGLLGSLVFAQKSALANFAVVVFGVGICEAGDHG